MIPLLTPKRLALLRFIWSYSREKGYAPTLSEMAEALHVSKVTVHEQVGKLVEIGALKKGEKYRTRALRVPRALRDQFKRDLERQNATQFPLRIEIERRRTGPGSNDFAYDATLQTAHGPFTATADTVNEAVGKVVHTYGARANITVVDKVTVVESA